MEALREALAEGRADPTVFLMGEDIGRDIGVSMSPRVAG